MSVSVTPEQLNALVQAAELISKFAVELGASRKVCKLTVREVLDEFQTAKLRLGKSKRYLRQVRVSVNGLLGSHLARPVVEISRADLQAAVESLSLAPRTIRGYVMDVATVFNFAVRQEYIARSPARFVETPVVLPKRPALHTPEEVARILNAARAFNLNFCRELAIRYFAGLRSAEAARLTEADIKADYIEVPAEKAKTRRRRLVPIEPNLREWLALGGVLPVGRVSGFAKRLERLSGVRWLGNVTRHSFCSYHLAHHGNAARTALVAGHTEAMLFAHYREVVTPEAAALFFNVRPASAQLDLFARAA